jgi:hypothetical protein
MREKMPGEGRAPVRYGRGSGRHTEAAGAELVAEGVRGITWRVSVTAKSASSTWIASSVRWSTNESR